MPASKTPRKREVLKVDVGGTKFYHKVGDAKIESKDMSKQELRRTLGDKGAAKLSAKKGKHSGPYEVATAAYQSTSQTTASPKRKLSQTEKNTTAKNESQRRISKVEAAREKRQSKKK